MNILFNNSFASKQKKFKRYIKSLSGLYAYYPLNDTSGDAINNAPSTLGTLNGTQTGATQSVEGRVGKSYGFGGDGDRVVINSLVPTTTFSFFCAFKKNGTPDANDRLLDQASGGPTRGWDIVLNSDNTATFHTWNNSGVALTLQFGTIPDNQWVTLAGSIGASASKLYLNGVEVASGGGNNFGSGVIAALNMMTRSGGSNNPAKGNLQHVAIANNVEWSAAIQAKLASFFLT